MGVQYHRADPVAMEFAFRSLPSGGDVFEGYSAVFNKPSKVLRDELVRNARGYRETLVPGAFTRSLNSRNRITFVVDHNERQMVSSAPTGALKLSEDTKGLHVESPWPRTPYTDSVRALYDTGERLGMSILFGTMRGGDSWTPDGSQRTVTEATLKHASVLATMEPAYDGTTASFRALADLTEADVEDIEDLIEALRDGRTLTEAEWNLAARMLDTVKPEATPTTTNEPASVLPDGVLAALARLDAELPRS